MNGGDTGLAAAGVKADVADEAGAAMQMSGDRPRDPSTLGHHHAAIELA